jgi:hypothetical protein
MTYQDRTWCPFLRCGEKHCDRRATATVKRAAEDARLPLVVWVDRPECYTRDRVQPSAAGE